ncbi:hypothetical protein [Roseateles amylovorans]|uniref:Uncharacterized protein n=1 Tax=Roseateles amylovorans TaxID=2978473 RepID=A0ABY6AX26_9BURK|nr:hypothetical protein [Roseateles amylovorans]UXH76858.1 hypothetical protein N4261_17715 [Roseateles amylovorans]
MAEKTKMTNENVVSYSLSFAGFSIEVRVDEQSSINFTNRFDQYGPDFVFAVAEIWLNHEGSTHLIVPATHPENFLECLRDLSTCVSSPPVVLGIEEVIPCGGWCSWMAGYWDRVDRESDMVSDEEIYELLIPASFVASKVGYIAVYVYGDKKIFEVAVRPDEGRKAIGVWAQFNSDALGTEVKHLAKVIAENICGAEKKPGKLG